MGNSDITKIAALAAEAEAVERTIQYMASRFATFLKEKEKVLICFPDPTNPLGYLFREAVGRCGGIPIMSGEDRRWKTLIRNAFTTRCTTIVGTPLVMLGLSKLARYMGTPLFIRNVVLAGYPSLPWMRDGIQRALDCKIWRWFDPGAGSIICGFSCGQSPGLHLRDEEYGVEILDPNGDPVAPGEVGEVILYPLSDPEIRFDTGDRGRLRLEKCPCGCNSPRISDFRHTIGTDPMLQELSSRMHYWTSILDCRITKTDYGLEVELVIFPGEKLPELPSCAKMVVRNWNPETDIPFSHMYVIKKSRYSDNSH